MEQTRRGRIGVFGTYLVCLLVITSGLAAVASARTTPAPSPLKVDEGDPGPPLKVSISDVRVDSNSLPGDRAVLRWTTRPSSSCDRFDWGITSRYGNTATLACGAHEITLMGLSRHVSYYFRITAKAPNYKDGTYASSFYATDASLDVAYQAYQRQSAYDSCGHRVSFNYFAQTPGDISFNPDEVQSYRTSEVFDMNFHYRSSSTGGCFGNTITTRRTRFQVWVTDSDGIVDWIAAKDQIIWSGYAGGSGTVSWGINVGGELYGASAGFSASYSPPSTSGFAAQVDNRDLGGGLKYLGYFQVDWPQQSSLSLDAMWPMFVLNQKAQNRLFDKVTFIVQLDVWWDAYTVFGWRGSWSYATESFSFTLGDGDWDGNRILDQYTNVQSGYMNGPEK